MAWTNACAQAQALYDRLTAIGLRVELLSEGMKAPRAAQKTLELIRIEIEDAARNAHELADEARAHVPRPGPSVLQDALHDTLAPITSYLMRRETTLVAPEIARDVLAAVEPAILRGIISGILDVLLRHARSGENVEITHESLGSTERLVFHLTIREVLPELPALLRDLAEPRALIEVRGGHLMLGSDDSSVSLTLELPSTAPARERR